MDWKKPLYDCAANMQGKGDPLSLRRAAGQFAYLGGYRDSAARAEQCIRDFDAQHEAVRGRIRDAGCSGEVSEAIRNLVLFWGCPEYEAELQTAREKETRLARTEKRRRILRVVRRAALAAAVIFILITAYGYHISRTHPVIRREALRAAEEKDYEKAAELYHKIRNGPFSEEARARIPELMLEAARQKIGQGAFEEARKILVNYGDEEDFRHLYKEWGIACMREKQYAEALSRFKDAGDHSLDGRVYSLWAADKADGGDYYGAVEILERADDEEGHSAQLKTLREGRARQAAGEVTGTVNYVKAAETGAKLDDIDGQLLYCRALREAGYDLKKVYPDGVVIRGLHPEQYRPTAENQGIAEDQELVILPFSRKEVNEYGVERSESAPYRYISPIHFRDRGVPWSRSGSDAFEMRLLPDVLYDLPESMRAESLEACTVFLLRDTFYLVEGSVAVRRGKNYSGDSGATSLVRDMSYYKLLSAADNVTLYDKEAPDRFHIFDYRKEMPAYKPDFGEGAEGDALRQIWEKMELKGQITVPNGNAAEIGRSLEICWGKPDPEYLNETMKQAVEILKGIRNGAEGER
ncbi:MAG: hypothetical protein IJJ38_02735 [Lachnospiraceae bacterium]|nr:hypothetical protein [Lachnospiraceae bacterium]